MQLRWHFLKDLVHNGIAMIEKIPTARNISDMLTKPVPRQTLRRCLIQAESWRTPEKERVQEENIAEIHMITLEENATNTDEEQTSTEMGMFLMMMTITVGLAGFAYLHAVAKRCCRRMTRTGGTQSQTTYTAVGHHATPLFEVVPDL